MRVGEVVRRTGASQRALRYYERRRLVVPHRDANGYRNYDDVAVRQVEIIRALRELGLSVVEAQPFVECLGLGHDQGDECPESLAAYRRAIEQLTERIDRLREQRDNLAAHLEAAANRAVPPAHRDGADSELSSAPDAERSEVGRALRGRRMPSIRLAATDGSVVDIGELGGGRTIVFVYPLTGRPGVDLPEGWDTIPGARGCTAEARGFRDQHTALEAAGARVIGLSSQTSEYQRELADRLRLPYVLLADPELRLRGELGLPTFSAGGRTFYERLSLVLYQGRIEQVVHPVVDPAGHGAQMVEWLTTVEAGSTDGRAIEREVG